MNSIETPKLEANIIIATTLLLLHYINLYSKCQVYDFNYFFRVMIALEPRLTVLLKLIILSLTLVSKPNI